MMPTPIISYFDPQFFTTHFSHKKYKVELGVDFQWFKPKVELEISPTVSQAMILCAETLLAGKSRRGVFPEASGDQAQYFKEKSGNTYRLATKIDELRGLVGAERVVWFEERPVRSGNFDVKPILVADIPNDKERQKFVSLKAVPGLAEILSPNLDQGIHDLFPLPNEKIVTPRLIVIRGGAGTGKSTFAVQLMIGLTNDGVNCEYFCTNDPTEAIRHTAVNYGFIAESEFDSIQKGTDALLKLTDISPNIPKGIANAAACESWLVKRISNRILGSKNDIESKAEAIFIDSIDPYLGIHQPTGTATFELRKLLRALKEKPKLSFLILEDSPGLNDPIALQHIADCEHMADIFIELKSDSRDGYQLNTMRVKKRHFGTHVRGWHEYKLLPRNHSLSNIDANFGFSLYPSLHYYLSTSRNDTWARKVDFTHTGIAHLDSILCSDRAPSGLDGRSMPRNSCVVIQGKDTTYDFALGTNILLGGLWEPADIISTLEDPENAEEVNRDRDVLIVSLNEETNLDLGREGLAFQTNLFTARSASIDLDNGTWIRWRRQDAILGKDAFKELLKRFEGTISVNTLCDDLINGGILKKAEGYKGPVYMVEAPDNLLSIDSLAGLTHRDINNDRQLLLSLLALLKSTKDGEEHWGGVSKATTSSNEEKRKRLDERTEVTLPRCGLHELLFDKPSNVGKKVVFNKWCTHLRDRHGRLTRECAKVVIATFRSGCITPEEFLRSLQLILNEGHFSRVMFVSTTLMGQRFPLLAKSDLFLEAIVALFKSRSMISIFLDPQHKDTKDPLSICLTGLADYLINLQQHPIRSFEVAFPTSSKENSDTIQRKKEVSTHLSTNTYENPWCEMTVKNLRGKNYTDALHLISVRPSRGLVLRTSQPDLNCKIREACRNANSANKVISKLIKWGFLTVSQPSDLLITTDLAFMQERSFLKLFEDELSRRNADAKKIWRAISEHRPEAENELHCINAPSSTLNNPNQTGKTPSPISVNQP